MLNKSIYNFQRIFQINMNLNKKSFFDKIQNFPKSKRDYCFINYKTKSNFSTEANRNLPITDLYKILDLNFTSDAKEIKQAYYKKAKLFHPDKHSSK